MVVQQDLGEINGRRIYRREYVPSSAFAAFAAFVFDFLLNAPAAAA